ncbi:MULTISPECIES: hypothetical protein [unclassified Rathayibacter]|uniref:hypothetical protein n=1 Tax=unclassified Rathayibacter TaxID=2609250 RepID=UPI00188AA283|nr:MULTISPECIES: hypothetical protein [unclassified Rathayibacter]MBF4463460.1 hypothetical protein [Rathayibacter sp. VKM Ac-2879]MBF4504818.1 hypothetical protein [Rathayibacter sp. VKM Ac-2878]
MPRPTSCAVLRRLVDLLEDPAPINIGLARHVRGLLQEALALAPDAATSGGSAVRAPFAGAAAGERQAAVAPEDTASTDPAL